MKKKNIYVSKILLGLFLFALLSFIGHTGYCLKKVSSQMPQGLSHIFENAIKINTENKMEGIHFVTKYNVDSNKHKIGDYETRTARYADTTFTFQIKIADFETTQFNNHQTFLLDTKQLRAIDVKAVFDSLLTQKGIHYTESVVGIHASFYTKLNDWSSDTTEIKANHRAESLGQGNYEDINYYAHIHRPFRTLWGLMPMQTIFLLFVCTTLSGLLLLCWRYKLETDKVYRIKLLKNGNYRIKGVLFEPGKQRFSKKGKEVQLADQPHDIFMLFLREETHRVSKEYIKMSFWPANMNPNTNMTSAINRLNRELKETGCAHFVATDPKDENYYILSYSNDA